MATSSPKFRRRELVRVRQMAGLPGLAGSSPKFRRRELSRALKKETQRKNIKKTKIKIRPRNFHTNMAGSRSHNQLRLFVFQCRSIKTAHGLPREFGVIPPPVF